MRARRATQTSHRPIAPLRSVGSILVGTTLLAGIACARLGTATGQREATPPTGHPITAIVGATVIHPERDEAAAVAPDTTLVIEGERIRAVGPRESVAVPAGATIVDGSGKWVVPGLVDGHVHFFQSGNLYTRPDVADFHAVVPYAAEVARNRARLPATFVVWLASGVTGVVDVGGPMWNFEVRDAARANPLAPIVKVAGPLVSMIDRPQLDLGDPPIIRAASADEARALVARELARQPDYVKVWFIHDSGDDLAAQSVIVKAAADAAHAAGVPLAVHATELVTAKAALRCGADYLVHSVEDEPVDAEFLALAKQRHALYCPTLFVGSGYDYALSNRWRPTDAESRLADPRILASMRDLDRMPTEKIPDRVRKYMARSGPIDVPRVLLDNLRAVRDAGIPIVMGTDAGNIGTLHGPSVYREMALMERAGLSRLEVLRSATTHGARALRMEGEVGAIRPGMIADLVVADANPLDDLANLSRAWRVVKDGRFHDPRELMAALD